MPEQLTPQMEVLYKAGSERWKIGDRTQFLQSMSDPAKQKVFYDSLSVDFDLGTFEEYSAKVNQDIGQPPTEELPTPEIPTADPVRDILSPETAKVYDGIKQQQVAKEDQNIAQKALGVLKEKIDITPEQETKFGELVQGFGLKPLDKEYQEAVAKTPESDPLLEASRETSRRLKEVNIQTFGEIQRALPAYGLKPQIESNDKLIEAFEPLLEVLDPKKEDPLGKRLGKEAALFAIMAPIITASMLDDPAKTIKGIAEFFLTITNDWYQALQSPISPNYDPIKTQKAREEIQRTPLFHTIPLLGTGVAFKAKIGKMSPKLMRELSETLAKDVVKEAQKELGKTTAPDLGVVEKGRLETIPELSKATSKERAEIVMKKAESERQATIPDPEKVEKARLETIPEESKVTPKKPETITVEPQSEAQLKLINDINAGLKDAGLAIKVKPQTEPTKPVEKVVKKPEKIKSVAEIVTERQIKQEERIKPILGTKVTVGKTEYELTGVNDIGVPYFSKVVNGEVQKTEFVISDYQKDWVNKQIETATLKEAPIIPKTEETPIEAKLAQEKAIIEPEAQKVSGVAQSIEAKAIEAELTKGGFKELSKFPETSIKEQSFLMSELMKDAGKMKEVLAGREPLPKHLNSATVVSTIEKYALKTKDGGLMAELAKSPLVAESSISGLTLRLLQERSPFSPVKAMKDIIKDRETGAKRSAKFSNPKKQQANLKNSLKNEQSKVKFNKNSWEALVREIICS